MKYLLDTDAVIDQLSQRIHLPNVLPDLAPRDVRARRGNAEVIARMLARLAHRFADREAILWRAGHDEASWSRIEEDMLAQLRDEVDRGELSTARVFVREMVQARLELIGPTARPSLDGPTVPSSPSSDDSVPTLARPAARVSFAQTMQSTGPFIIEGPPTNEDDPLAITLSSISQRDEDKPPRQR